MVVARVSVTSPGNRIRLTGPLCCSFIKRSPTRPKRPTDAGSALATFAAGQRLATTPKFGPREPRSITLSNPADRRPSDRTYGRLHWTFFTLIAALLCYGLLLSRFIPTPRAVGFRMVLLIILSFNALWWSVADRRFARHVRSPGRSRALRLLLVVFSAALNAPLFYLLVAGSSLWFLGTPEWYAAAVALWHLGLVTLMPLVALARLAYLTAAYAVRMGLYASRTAQSPLPRAPRPVFTGHHQHNPDRRAHLRTALATVPVTALVAATAAATAQAGRLAVNRHTLPAPWLPKSLRGLTITHISDLHVGRHYRPHMLRQLVDRANALDSDLVLITGDIVDQSNDMLPPAIHAISQLTHRHGLFICIGNHDQIDNRRDFIRRLGHRFPLLLNQRRSLNIAGQPLTIAGLDYASRDLASIRRPGHHVNTNLTLLGHDSARDGPVIALSHHPHAFDRLADAGVPLTLAGHTHGGQLMLSDPRRRPDVGIGRLLFRYTRGFYHRGPGTLFVNSGVGNWFPLRIHAPAEIVQLRLV